MRFFAYWLLMGVVFTIPWENAVTVEGIGTLTRAIGIGAGMMWMLSCLIDRKFRRPHLFFLFAFLFILWSMLSFYWSVGVDETVQQIESYVQLGVMAWMLWDLYSTQAALRAALQAYIVGAYVSIFSSIANYLEGQTISEYEPGRYTGAGINAVELAVILSLGLPISWYLATSVGNSIKGQFLKFINYAFIPLSVFSIMITGSRTTFFILAPAFLYIGGKATHIRPVIRILVLAVVVGALLFAIAFIPEETITRLLTIGGSVTAFDFGGRGALWRESISVFTEHPLVGVGSGALKTSGLLNTVAHNTYLSVLAELGIIGFLLFVGMIAIVAYHAAKQFKSHTGLWITIFLIWMIGCMSLTWELTKPTWLFLSLIIISGSLQTNIEHRDGNFIL